MRLQDNPPTIWTGVFDTFRDAACESRGEGFRSATYLERSRAVTQECIDAVNAGVPIPAFHVQRATLLNPLVATVMASKGAARVLDFGGGFAIGYLSCRSHVEARHGALEYLVIDFPAVCELARPLFPDDEIIQFASEASAADGRRFDIVYSASALQYVEDWKSATAMLAGHEAPYLILADVFAGDIEPFVSLQIYHDSTIPHWFLNMEEAISHLQECGYDLLMKEISRGVRRGIVDRLPMSNFSQERQVPYAWNLLFGRGS